MSRMLDQTIDAHEWVQSGMWADGDSSNVKGIAFIGGELFVEFLDGSIYAYKVSPLEAVRMYEGPSLGKHVWRLRRLNVPVRNIKKGSGKK